MTTTGTAILLSPAVSWLVMPVSRWQRGCTAAGATKEGPAERRMMTGGKAMKRSLRDELVLRLPWGAPFGVPGLKIFPICLKGSPSAPLL